MAKIKLIANTESYSIYNGSMLDMLEIIEPNSIDSIVCDPPYELNFMNKEWDRSGIAFQKETWEKCYEVLKPGGYLLAFGGSRTHHRIACAIEDAGFEIRDTIMWLYGSGFPKSMNLSKGLEARQKLGNAGTRNKRKIEQACDSEEYTLKQSNNGIMGEIKETTRKKYIPNTDLAKQWEGWGTALKPAYEPIIVARKPFKGSLVDNVIKYGVGGINIDECRIDYNGEIPNIGGRAKHTRGDGYGFKPLEENCVANTSGRFPANTILTYDETDYEEVCGGFPVTKPTKKHNGDGKLLDTRNMGWGFKRMPSKIEDNGGSASRYFYCAKASKKDRDEGLYDYRKNLHPTVKPCELMQYLIRLVTPKGGIILDPFMGSGSTGKAAMFENRERQADYKFIGIDLEEEYCNIASARIYYALNKYKYDYQQKLKKAKEKGQMSLF